MVVVPLSVQSVVYVVKDDSEVVALLEVVVLPPVGPTTDEVVELPS